MSDEYALTRTLPWHADEHPLPPHDLRLYANDGTVLARWSGETMDEHGRRPFDTETFEAIRDLVAAVAEMAEWHAKQSVHHITESKVIDAYIRLVGSPYSPPTRMTIEAEVLREHLNDAGERVIDEVRVTGVERSSDRTSGGHRG